MQLSNAPTGAATVRGQSPCRYAGQGKNVTGPSQLRHAGSMQPGQLSPGLPLDTPQNQTRVLARANVRIQHRRKVNRFSFGASRIKKKAKNINIRTKHQYLKIDFLFLPASSKRWEMDLQNAPGDGTRKGSVGWGICEGPISRPTMPQAGSPNSGMCQLLLVGRQIDLPSSGAWECCN